MRHLHGCGIVHGHLSPHTILVDHRRHPAIVALERGCGPGAPDIPEVAGAPGDVLGFGRIAELVVFGRPLALKRHFADPWRRIVDRCRADRPEVRPTFAEVLETLHETIFRTQVDCVTVDEYLWELRAGFRFSSPHVPALAADPGEDPFDGDASGGGGT
jgi:hypothetical protein